MNIAKLIAKFTNEGLEKMNEEELTLLKNNVGLLSPAGKAKYEEATKTVVVPEAKADAKADVEAIDEVALKAMIAKSVQEEVTSTISEANIDKIAESLVAKAIAGAEANRAKVIDTDVKLDKKSQDSTRGFIKALLGRDEEKLVEMKQKATTYNYTGDDARGGYTIPEELQAEVLRIAEEQYGLARQEFQYLPFGGPGNERKIPTLASSVSVSWVDEAGTKPSTNPVFGLVTQTLKKLVAMVPFTEEILEDTAIDLTSFIAKLVAEAFAKEEDAQFFDGSGSPWTGILHNGSVGSVALATAEGMSDVTFEKLVDMQDELPSGAMAGAKYYMHRHVMSYLRKLRTSAITASDNLGAFLLPLNKAGIEGILDFPVVLSDAFPDKTLTGALEPFVVFGNLKMAAIFGDKQQVRAKLLDQATITDGDGSTSINLAQENMLALRMEERVGYVLALPTAVVVLTTGAAS